MGSDDADADEKPAHRVHLDDFLIAVHRSPMQSTSGSFARPVIVPRPFTSFRSS
jgi:hypothetical protein